MFLKEKISPTGQFEKIKARLVAGGDQQDKSLYTNLSAATAATSSVFMIAAIAAREKRRIVVVDITGAYLNASMTSGVIVHMKIDKPLTEVITNVARSPRWTVTMHESERVSWYKAFKRVGLAYKLCQTHATMNL
jgi:hypothetical protein